MAILKNNFLGSRHSGENRSPDALQLLENTDSGFRRNDEKWYFWTFYEPIKFGITYNHSILNHLLF